MFHLFHKKDSETPQTFIVGVFLLSFLVGSVSGAVFGVVGATMISNTLNQAAPIVSLGSRSRGQAEPAPIVIPPQGVADVVQRSAPAVVSIVITKDVPKLGSGSPFFRFGDPFDGDFFNFFGQPRSSTPPQTEKREVGGGTGFFVSADGLIITNKHVVADEDAEYTVLLNSGKKYPAKVVSIDPTNDLAVVKIDGSGFPTIPLGDSSTLRLGDSVIAIGNALGEFRNTVSTGVVSGLSRSITAGGSALGTEQLSGVIQTDAAINPGNSGGPLLNYAGEVVGINTAVAQGAQNIGFAIPVNEAKQVITSVKKYGRIVRPFLGVRYIIITSDLAKEKSLPVDYGALIVRGETRTDLAVTPGSPADKAGLVENDIILEVGGEKITEDNPLVKAIARYGVGDRVPLKIMHRGDTKAVTVTLVERK
jgi:serine protease Do